MMISLSDMFRAVNAIEGCDHPKRFRGTDPASGLCKMCGLHEHECWECRHVWSHDARIMTDGTYDEAHECPACLSPQRWKRGTEGSDLTIELGRELTREERATVPE